MNRSKKRSLRFKVSLLWAMVTAIVVFLCGYSLVTLVKIKRINDLANHSQRLANQISQLSSIRLYLMESTATSNKPEAEDLLRLLLEGDPFIEELVLIDQFGNIPFSILYSGGEMSAAEDSSSISFTLQEILVSKKPSLLENKWEYRIPIMLDSSVPWGMMKVRWRSDATWKYFNLLKAGVAYITSISFFLSFIIGYFLLRKTYGREQIRFAKQLSLICGSDYNQRIDTQAFSKGFADIGVHLNRILHETEEEKKKSEVLDQSLRQIERGCSDYRRTLHERTSELDIVRREMREGLACLFDMLWCGIVIIDDAYRIHFINEQAERLLRFARLEDSILSDERLKTCLAPLVRHGNVEAVDDLCVWPQPSLGHSVSCQVRAMRTSAGGPENLFFVLLREEGGYPKHHNSAYYSERLILDYLVHDPSLGDSSSQSHSENQALSQETRFRACLRRLDTFHALEKGDSGPVSSIRLTAWIRNHFSDEDLFSNYLYLDANVPDLDISLRIPEKILRELVDTMMVLISRMVENKQQHPSQYSVLRASLDSRGKPMITLAIPGILKKEAVQIHDVLNERASNMDEYVQNGSLEDLEMDICYSLFRCVKQLLRANIVCVYSEIKKLAMVRMTIENHTFHTPKTDESGPESNPSPNPDLIQQFLSRI